MMQARAICLGLMLAGGPCPAQAQPEDVHSYGEPTASDMLLLRGTTDIAMFDPLLEAFSAAHADLRLTYEQWGRTSSMIWECAPALVRRYRQTL